MRLERRDVLSESVGIRSTLVRTLPVNIGVNFGKQPARPIFNLIHPRISLIERAFHLLSWSTGGEKK